MAARKKKVIKKRRSPARKKVSKRRISPIKSITKQKPFAVPYQFGNPAALTTHYFDARNGDDLGPRPNERKYHVLRLGG